MLSIKKRLTILLCFPLILLLILALAEIKQDVFVLNQLSFLQQRTALMKSLINLNNHFHEQRIAVLYQELQRLKPKHFNQQLNNIKSTMPYALQNEANQASSIQLVNEMSNLEGEFYETDSADIADWSTWFTNAIENIFYHLEKDHLEPTDEVLKANQQTLYQLQWLYFWANEERWYAHLFLQKPAEEIKKRLFTINERQQVFFERIIATNSDPLQISMLKNIFTDNSFMASYVLNNLIQGDDYVNKNTYNIAELDRRISLIKSVTLDIHQQYTARVNQQISATKLKLTLVLLSLATGVVLFLLQGLNVVSRVISNLNILTHQLRNLIKNNTSSKLEISGQDEFSDLTETVNELSELVAAKQSYLVSQQAKLQEDEIMRSVFFNELSEELGAALAIMKAGKHSENTKDEIKETLEKLFLMHHELRTYTGNEQPDNRLVLTKTNLRELIYSIVNVLQPLAFQREKRFVVEMNKALPSTLLLDDNKLRQILSALYKNMLNTSFGGEIRLTVEAMPLPNQRCDLHIVMEDSNNESDEINETLIYPSYRQQLISTENAIASPNVGLAASTSFVTQMGGELSIELSNHCHSIIHFGFQAAVVESVVQQQSNESVNTIYLVKNGNDMSRYILSEISILDNITVKTVDYMTELELEVTGSDLIVYCQQDIKLTTKDFTLLSTLQPDMQLLLCREYTPEAEALDDRVVDVITMPVLGDKFIRAIQSHFYIDSDDNTQSQQA